MNGKPDLQANPLKQSVLAGRVIKVDEDEGICVELLGPADSSGKQLVFMLPGNLGCWFHSPPGSFPTDTGRIENPDPLVTRDVFQTRPEVTEGQHSWWQWQPRMTPPQVG